MLHTKEIKIKDYCLVISKKSKFYLKIIQITHIFQAMSGKIYSDCSDIQYNFWREDLIPIVGTMFSFIAYDNDILGEKITLPAIGVSKDLKRIQFNEYSVYSDEVKFELKNELKNKLFDYDQY